MTEIIPVGGAFCTQGHLHYPEEFGYVELVDPVTSQPAEPGRIAMIVATPYAQYRQCTMLLRYATGDLVRVLDAEPACELAHMPASSDIVGRYSGPLSVELPTRSILELLEAERAVPLPVRYSLAGEPGRAVLHVAAPHASPALRGRLEERATRAGLPLAAIVLHEDAATLPSPAPLRADLREHTFELAARHRTAEAARA
jgi:phenylacetate-CoA ligase